MVSVVTAVVAVVIVVVMVIVMMIVMVGEVVLKVTAAAAAILVSFLKLVLMKGRENHRYYSTKQPNRHLPNRYSCVIRPENTERKKKLSHSTSGQSDGRWTAYSDLEAESTLWQDSQPPRRQVSACLTRVRGDQENRRRRAKVRGGG